MANQDKGRRNPQFDLSIPEQKRTYDFLGIAGRDQSVYLAHIVDKFLTDNNVKDVNSLTKADLKRLIKTPSTATLKEVSLSEINLQEAIRKVLREEGFIEGTIETQKAHGEPLNKKEMTKAHDGLLTEESLENEDENDEEDNDLGLNEDLLSELSAFG